MLCRSIWWSCAIQLAQPLVDNVSGQLLMETSFRGFGFRHFTIRPLLSQAPKFGNLSRSRLDNRVTIYCFSNRNWKRIYFSSSERFCRSISNKGPYEFPILLLLLLIISKTSEDGMINSIKSNRWEEWVKWPHHDPSQGWSHCEFWGE